MNWFTRNLVSTDPAVRHKKAADLDNCCEHVEADPAELYVIVAENDSFGSETTGLCKACDEEAKRAKTHVCADCGKTFNETEGIAWKWYDFYAPQGDEPLYVCDACVEQEKHKKRVKDDHELYLAEMRHYR